MSLPILHTSTHATPDALARYFHQTERDWTRHLAEETALDVGTAFCNPQLPNVWDANCVLDAALPETMSPAQAVEVAREHFDACGVACRRWVMNPSAPAQRTQPLVEHLLADGHRADAHDILYLAQLPQTKVVEVGGLKIIPARASFRHARQLAEEAAQRWDEPTLADAMMEHVQDPHFDAVLALKDGQAVATAGVLAVGEIGRIDDVYVAERFRRLGIGRTMMSRALEICARSLFKHVLLACRHDNVAAQALYRTLGFVKIGVIAQYTKADPPSSPPVKP